MEIPSRTGKMRSMSAIDTKKILADVRSISVAQKLLADLEQPNALMEAKHMLETLDATLTDIQASFLESVEGLELAIQELQVVSHSALGAATQSLLQAAHECQEQIGRVLSGGEAALVDACGHGHSDALGCLDQVDSHLERTRAACEQMRSSVSSTIGRVGQPFEEIQRIVTPLRPMLAVLEEVL